VQRQHGPGVFEAHLESLIGGNVVARLGHDCGDAGTDGQLRPAGGWEGRTVGSESLDDGLPAEAGLGGGVGAGWAIAAPQVRCRAFLDRGHVQPKAPSSR
jgi:hypothetical protein